MERESKWFWIGEHLQADMAAVFLGSHAAEAMEIPWPESCVHHAPERTGSDGSTLSETTKLYLPWGKISEEGISISLKRLDVACAEHDVSPSWCEWQFMRVDARVACCRASEEGAIWGFGRLNPFNQGYKPHQNYAGPLRDCSPKTVGIPEGWRFEPVFMKVEPDENPKNIYHIKIHPEWMDEEVMLIVEDSPDDVPEVLRMYEFGKKGKKVQQKRF